VRSRLGELKISKARYEDLLGEANHYYPEYLKLLATQTPQEPREASQNQDTQHPKHRSPGPASDSGVKTADEHTGCTSDPEPVYTGYVSDAESPTQGAVKAL